MGTTRKISSARPLAQSHTQHKYQPKLHSGLTPTGFKVAPAKEQKVPLYDVRGQMSFNTTGKQVLGAMLLLNTLGSVIKATEAAPQFVRVTPSTVQYQNKYISCTQGSFFYVIENRAIACYNNGSATYQVPSFGNWHPGINVANASDITPECNAYGATCSAPYKPFAKNSQKTALYNGKTQIHCDDPILFKTQGGPPGSGLEQATIHCLKNGDPMITTVNNTDHITELPVPFSAPSIQIRAGDLCEPAAVECEKTYIPPGFFKRTGHDTIEHGGMTYLCSEGQGFMSKKAYNETGIEALIQSYRLFCIINSRAVKGIAIDDSPTTDIPADGTLPLLDDVENERDILQECEEAHKVCNEPWAPQNVTCNTTDSTDGPKTDDKASKDHGLFTDVVIGAGSGAGGFLIGSILGAAGGVAAGKRCNRKKKQELPVAQIEAATFSRVPEVTLAPARPITPVEASVLAPADRPVSPPVTAPKPVRGQRPAVALRPPIAPKPTVTFADSGV